MKTIDLDNLHLDSGGHSGIDEGVCLLEAVAWFANEPHSDHPSCVSPYLAAYGRRLNDVLPDDRRQELVPLIPRLAGTANDGKDFARRALALDHVYRVAAPRWFDLAGFNAQAAALRALPADLNPADIDRARALCREVSHEAWPKRQTFRQALRDAVYNAVKAKLAKPAAGVAAAVAAAAAGVAAVAADAADAADAAVAAAAAAADAADAAADVVAAAVAADVVAADVAVAAAADADVAVADVAVAVAAVAAAAADAADAYRLRRSVYDQVYKAVRAALEARWGTLVTVSRDDAIALYIRLTEV
jgi:hypothetical protein